MNEDHWRIFAIVVVGPIIGVILRSILRRRKR